MNKVMNIAIGLLIGLVICTGLQAHQIGQLRKDLKAQGKSFADRAFMESRQVEQFAKGMQGADQFIIEALKDEMGERGFNKFVEEWNSKRNPNAAAK